MALILNIETSGPLCSVALGKEGKVLAEKISSEPNAHSSLLTVLIESLCNDTGISLKMLDAICVSEGPGSYTGLRIGVAAAKGLCYALEIPLLCISSLKVMAAHPQVMAVRDAYPQRIPMIDARRMEIYTAVIGNDDQFMMAPRAEILSEPYVPFFDPGIPALVFGSGMPKTREILSPYTHITWMADIEPLASSMTESAELQFAGKQFCDLAYVEPFYLKEFYTGKP